MDRNWKMTRKDLAYYYSIYPHCKIGYCCYQDDGKSRFSLREIGYNSGVYGWNWTALVDDETETLYISCYRNVPAYMTEK
jgi:hypothetical protein